MKPILFLYPYGYWKANPNCVSLVQRCEKAQIPFDLICPSQKECLGNSKAISEWLWFVRRIVPSAFRQSLRRPWKIINIWTSVLHFFVLKHKIKKNTYSVIITCDPSGLGLLSRLKPHFSTPVVYLSFHILFRSEIQSKNEQALASREREAAFLVQLALSQDENRRNHASTETSIDLNKFSCISVAPEANWFPQSTQKSVATKSKTILYCGNLESWNLQDLLENLAQNLPKDFHFRIHTHFKPSSELLNKLWSLEKKNLLEFTYSFLTEQELVRLIDSSFMGLAPYFPKSDSWMVNKTLYHIGKASTKIAYYCMRQKPVITTPLPSLVSALSHYQFGVALENWSHISEAVARIENNYELFSSEARRYYEKELDPTHTLDAFWKKIQDLIPNSSPE